MVGTESVFLNCKWNGIKKIAWGRSVDLVSLFISLLLSFQKRVSVDGPQVGSRLGAKDDSRLLYWYDFKSYTYNFNSSRKKLYNVFKIQFQISVTHLYPGNIILCYYYEQVTQSQF